MTKVSGYDQNSRLNSFFSSKSPALYMMDSSVIDVFFVKKRKKTKFIRAEIFGRGPKVYCTMSIFIVPPQVGRSKEMVNDRRVRFRF